MQIYSAIIHDNFVRQNGLAGLKWLFGAVGRCWLLSVLLGVTAYGVEQRSRFGMGVYFRY